MIEKEDHILVNIDRVARPQAVSIPQQSLFSVNREISTFSQFVALDDCRAMQSDHDLWRDRQKDQYSVRTKPEVAVGKSICDRDGIVRNGKMMSPFRTVQGWIQAQECDDLLAAIK